MKLRAAFGSKFFRPAVGAALAALCGLLLWGTDLGAPWERASYDYIFRFGARPVTNQMAVILMDNAAYGYYTNETRGQPWSRALHAELLNRLADDGCALVVLDTFLRAPRDRGPDHDLAAALRRQRGVVLMAKQAESEYQKPDQKLDSLQPELPAECFQAATSTNWGVAWLDKDLDYIVRRHWPFPSPDVLFPSLPWKAAQVAGARLSEEPSNRWLRYYGERGQWTSLSYHFALGQPPNYFRDKFVFIGSKPESPTPDDEEDEFRTPYTRWTGESMGGVEIQAAAFLNLLNDEWLRRPPDWMEALVLVLAGALLGGWSCRLRPLRALAVLAGVSLAVTLGSVSWSYATSYWFPWLIIVGAQAPCALAGSVVVSMTRAEAKTTILAPPPVDIVPEVPDYDLVQPPFGQGAYGRVWLARNAIGQWQALKAVYRDSFGKHAEPFERELRGIERYKPISDKHPGLLRVDFVSRPKPEGYFYYVMELGDGQAPGWEENPRLYRPRDLASVRAQAPRGRLPAWECVRIALPLAEALDFLHGQELTHRDIKPQNIVFVHGRPKLADVGLVAELQLADQQNTYVGTPGYMPPLPESPGTPQADIYGLGMVLYVISTGRDPVLFPELSATLVEATDSADFIRLNSIILKACQPDRTKRYASAAEMAQALRDADGHMGRTKQSE